MRYLLTDIETNVKLLLRNKTFIMKTFFPSSHWCDSLRNRLKIITSLLPVIHDFYDVVQNDGRSKNLGEGDTKTETVEVLAIWVCQGGKYKILEWYFFIIFNAFDLPKIMRTSGVIYFKTISIFVRVILLENRKIEWILW